MNKKVINKAITNKEEQMREISIEGKHSKLIKDIKGYWHLQFNGSIYQLNRLNNTPLPTLTNRKHWAINLIRKYWDNVI